MECSSRSDGQGGARICNIHIYDIFQCRSRRVCGNQSTATLATRNRWSFSISRLCNASAGRVCLAITSTGQRAQSRAAAQRPRSRCASRRAWCTTTGMPETTPSCTSTSRCSRLATPLTSSAPWSVSKWGLGHHSRQSEWWLRHFLVQHAAHLTRSESGPWPRQCLVASPALMQPPSHPQGLARTTAASGTLGCRRSWPHSLPAECS